MNTVLNKLESLGVVDHSLVWDLQCDRYFDESGKFVRADPCCGELSREPVYANGIFVGHVWCCDTCHESIQEDDLVAMLSHADSDRDSSDWEYDPEPEYY